MRKVSAHNSVNGACLNFHGHFEVTRYLHDVAESLGATRSVSLSNVRDMTIAVRLL